MPEIQEEEIDLREYINVLLKRKGIIILIFLIAVITAAIISYFALSPIYQSSIVFSVAQVDSQPVINIAEALEIIKSNVVLDEVINQMSLEETTEQLKPQITTESQGGTNFIKVTVEADTPEKAKSLVENIVKVFIEQNQDEYEEKVKLIEDRLKILELQVAEFEKNIQEIEKTKKKIAVLEELSEAERQFQTSLLLNSSVTERSLYNSLIGQVNSLKISLNNCQDFKIINYAQLPTAPIKPRKELNIVIAGVLGLFVGIFVSFFLEFWQKGK
ncbi:MAG: Wzz/FepE/Etk N-terminal domain-containing protein [Candidatus Atribacteria bacterium]|nr:Wzz/FepE/Etk N-terminal domain-containing protein [Candidatus Atribacteria bacterium]